MAKKIHLLEPYGGFINTEEFLIQHKFLDTGLCNRLFYWNDLYHNIKTTDYKIYVEKIWWPELDIISLPKTIRYDYGHTVENYVSKKRGLMKSNIAPLNSVHDILTHDEYYTNYEYKPRRYRVPNIKFKNQELSNFIKKFAKNLIGIHIRRGNGTSAPVLNETYVDKVGNEGTVKESDMRILKYRRKHKFRETEAPYIPNDYYIQLIEYSLQKYGMKFYISSDVPDKFQSEIINKFKDNVYTYDQLYKTHLKKFDTTKYGWPYENTFKNVFDLFCLSYCSKLIGYPMSSWSNFAQNKGKRKIFINDKYVGKKLI